MPNWCDNRLYIVGDTETIKTFIEKVTVPEDEREKRGQEYDILGNLYPTPLDLVNTVSGFFGKDDTEKQAELEAKQANNRAKYGATDWYDWNCRNWGTKWGDSDTFMAYDEPTISPDGQAHIEFAFQTAWSPALEGIAHIAKMFPSLKFACSYLEEGMGFYGFCTFVDGEAIDNCEQVEDIDGYSKIDFDDEESWEKVSDLIMEARDALLESSDW